MRSALFLILCFFTPVLLSAQTLILTGSNSTYDASKYIQYAIDTNSNKLIEEMKGRSVKWQSFKKGQTPSMGIRKETFWFSLAIQNNSDRNEWILHVDYRTLDDVSLFIFDSAGTLLLSDSQGILTKNTRHQRMPVFPLFLEKNKSVMIYLRVQTSSLLIFPVKISTPLAFSESENAQRNVYLPALGILLAMLLINILLLSTSREKAYLFLSLSIAFEICFIAAIGGLFYEYVQFDPPVLLQKFRFVFLGLAYGFHTLFAVHYVNLKNHKFIWMVELTAVSGFFLYSFLAGTGMLNAYTSGALLVPINIGFFLLQFTIAGYLAMKKTPMASYYLLSFSPIILAMLLYIAVFNSWIEANLFFSNSGLYASALFTILLTFGLTEKMIKVKHATARANQLEIDKVALNAEITRRKEVETKLKELNLTKDKFFSIIAHDLVNPFHAMILYSKELKVFTEGNKRASDYNTNLLLTAQNTYSLLQNLLTWSRTQTRQISFNPQPVNLGDIVADNVANALNIARSKQIDIVNEASEDMLIQADLQMINLVLRNLISNSIKFSFNQGHVKISSHEEEDQISISVIDNGTGIDTGELNTLFNLFETAQRPGTAGEAGTGLGLIICHEFVRYHGGSIHVESEPGKGSTFKVTLPKKQK